VPLKLEDVRERYAGGQRYIKLLIHGQPGAGKTLLASTFPHPVYLDAEAGLLSVRDRDVKAVRVTSIAVLDEMRAALAQSPEVREKVLGAPVETVILDTVDEISRLIIRERLRAEKHETMQMQDWGYLGDTLRALLRGFRNLPMHVVFNVHLKDNEDQESGRVWFTPSVQGQVGHELPAYVDEALLLTSKLTVDPKTGEKVVARYLQTYPDLQYTWVKDRSGTLPQEFPVDFATDFERLATLIFGDVPQPAPSPPAPAESPESTPASATRTQARPAPDTRAPAKTTGPTPAPAPSPTPAPVAAENGEEAPETIPCTDCQTPLHAVDDANQITQSKFRWDVPLCRECYVARKTAKTKAKATTAKGE
jgi:cell division septation protein DedD